MPDDGDADSDDEDGDNSNQSQSQSQSNQNNSQQQNQQSNKDNIVEPPIGTRFKDISTGAIYEWDGNKFNPVRA